MELEDAIKTRRSVRKYQSKSVPKESISEVLEAANLAPSATNRQPWDFVVVHRSYLDRLEQLFREAFAGRVASISEDTMRQAIKDLPIPVDESGDKLKGLGHFYRTLGGAPVAIVVCVPKETDHGYGKIISAMHPPLPKTFCWQRGTRVWALAG